MTYENKDINIKNSFNFIHFDSPYLIKKFKSKKYNLTFGHECCSGKGVCILYKTKAEILLLKKEFLNLINKQKINYTLKGTCGICLEENIYINSTNCKHDFCLDCLNKWKLRSSTCPMCRKILIN